MEPFYAAGYDLHMPGSHPKKQETVVTAGSFLHDFKSVASQMLTLQSCRDSTVSGAPAVWHCLRRLQPAGSGAAAEPLPLLVIRCCHSWACKFTRNQWPCCRKAAGRLNAAAAAVAVLLPLTEGASLLPCYGSSIFAVKRYAVGM